MDRSSQLPAANPKVVQSRSVTVNDHYTIATTPKNEVAASSPTQQTGDEIHGLLHGFSSKAELLKARSEIKYDILLTVFTIMFVGLMFGFFMNKSRVFDPFIIRDQFKWEKMLMLKLFCAAGGTSCFSLILCYFLFKEVKKYLFQHNNNKEN